MPKHTYKKANSFVEFKSKHVDHAVILDRIKKFSTSNWKKSPSGYFEQIVNQACQDLLAESPQDASSFKLLDHVVEEIRMIPDKALPDYLFYRYRYDVFPQIKKLDQFPPCLQIEPSSICNYRCVFCYQTDTEFTNAKNGYMGTMPLDLFKKLVDQAEGQCQAVTLASRGEPLMARGFEDMLAYAHGKFLAFKINTNAWFLDEQKIHALLQAEPSTLVFSADAASEPLYSQLRVNGKLDRVLANIRKFQEIRQKQYPQSNIITRVAGVRYSKEQRMDDMERLWGELVDQVAFVDYNPWEDVYNAAPNNIETPCSDLWRRMFVWFDGTVNPCDVDFKSKLKAGNATEEPLSKIWQGENYTQLRQAHLNKKRSQCFPCQKCSVV